MSTEQLAARIRAGEVLKGALVCEVGGNAWRALHDVAEISSALQPVELQRADASAFDDPHEHTIVERPVFASFDAAADESDDGDDVPTIRPPSPLD